MCRPLAAVSIIWLLAESIGKHQIRIVGKEYIKNILAVSLNATTNPKLQIDYELEITPKNVSGYALNVEIKNKSGKSVCNQNLQIENEIGSITVKNLKRIKLWNIKNPHLYDVEVHLLKKGKVIDDYAFRTGFRECRFKRTGFYLNNKRIKLIGMNRHQTFPYIGAAGPAKLQQVDAEIIKNDLKCNIVRTSHYPQSQHFLNRCDEIGLLVFEEMPGWQHVGDDKWKELAYQSIEEMIETDAHHPSIIIWGVRVNESKDDDEFYAKTNAIAHNLDISRQTGGVRKCFSSRLLEDVFTINDFNMTQIQPPNHDRYFVTEFCGHMYPVKTYDNIHTQTQLCLYHAEIINEINTLQQHAGGIAWSAFDYNTHADFGSGNRVCHHGMHDMFRTPKPVAFFYKSQCSPDDEIVLEPAFYWCIGDWPNGGLPDALFMSNCDVLKIYLDNKFKVKEYPKKDMFPHLKHPPFICKNISENWGKKLLELKVEGYVKGKKVITRKFSSKGIDSKLNVILDHNTLIANGADMTRLAFTVTDQYDNIRFSTSGVICIDINGPAEIIGDNPFALSGGRGSVYIKSRQKPGTIKIKISHPVLGSQIVKMTVLPSQKEKV